MPAARGRATPSALRSAITGARRVRSKCVMVDQRLDGKLTPGYPGWDPFPAPWAAPRSNAAGDASAERNWNVAATIRVLKGFGHTTNEVSRGQTLGLATSELRSDAQGGALCHADCVIRYAGLINWLFRKEPEETL